MSVTKSNNKSRSDDRSTAAAQPVDAGVSCRQSSGVPLCDARLRRQKVVPGGRWLLAVSGLMGLMGGQAQALNALSIADMSLEELLETPVTLASLQEETFAQAPSSMTVFTRREILDMGIRTVEELLNYVPGMQAVRSGRRDQHNLAVRGQPSLYGGYGVLFLLNGQRLNDEFAGSALLNNRLLTTKNLRRVEVIRGPGSALYGASAFVGVVNLVTHDELNEAAFALGSHEGYDGHFAVSHSHPSYRASLFGAVLEDDGQSDTDPLDPAQRSMRDAQQRKTLFGTFETNRVRLEGRYSNFVLDDYYVFFSSTTSPANRYESTDASLGLEAQLYRSDAVTLGLQAEVGYTENVALSQFLSSAVTTGWPAGTVIPAPADNPYPPVFGGQVAELWDYNLGLQGEWRLSERQSWLGGMEVRRTDYRRLDKLNNYELVDILSLFRTGSGTVAYYDDIIQTGEAVSNLDDRDNASVYMQHRYQWTDALQSTLGLRYDYYKTFGDAVSPRAALVFRVSESDTLKLMAGQAFRAPTLDQLYSANNPNPDGNPDLKPETIQTWELAWLKRWNNYHLTLTGYHSRLENLIFTDATGETDNVGQSESSGIEAELMASWSPRWWLRAGYAHDFNGAVRGERYMSEHLASLIINHRRDRWNFNLSSTYQTSYANPSTDPAMSYTLDGHLLVNTHVRYDFGKAEAFATISNLLDTDYETPLINEFGAPGRGREWRLGFRLPF